MCLRAFSLLASGALLSFGPSLLSAQAEFGIKGGVSFGDISNKGLLPGDLDNRTGFAAGAAFGWRSTGPLGFGVEALFAQRGVTSKSSAGDERKLNYLDIPAYLELQVPLEGIIPYGYVGPEVSFELSCRNEDTDCPTSDRPKTDYAGVIGAGVRLGAVGKSGFSAEARYVYGLRDLKPTTITSDESFKTRSFLILAGIYF
jgi:outer membrane protein with beta-barrel domain